MSETPDYPEAWNVPAPPSGTLWEDHLRWCVFVMNRDDPQRSFAASCLSWAIKSGGLTDRQAAACSNMLRRVTAAYDAAALDCQAEPEPQQEPTPQRKDMH